MTWGGIFEIEKKQAGVSLLEKESAQPSFWQDKDRAQKTISELNNLKSTVDSWTSLKRRAEEVTGLLGMMEDEDPHLLDDITRDLQDLQKGVESFKLLTVLSGPYDKHNAIFSVHPGAGGVEACDWADMLLRMYMRWMEKKDLKVQVVDILPGGEAGIKNATLIINGDYAYGYLKAESGVHRLVRISPFDANKRRHTSFASVDVIPEIEDAEVQVEDKDLKIETFRSSGPGGQHMQKTSSAVRITHIPTGIVVSCENDRSQFKNKESAMKVLRSRLFIVERQKQEDEIEKIRGVKEDIAWGSQIRSYVLEPYQMVKDLRTDIETSNVNAVLDGDLDMFIEGFLRSRVKVKS